jgi:hypothetical protein
MFQLVTSFSTFRAAAVLLTACSICSRIMTMMLLAIAAYFECRGNNLVTKLIRYLMLIGLAYDLQ